MNPSAHRSCCSGPTPPAQSRRTFLERSAMGMGGVALACLLNDQRLLAEPPAKPPDPHALDMLPRSRILRHKPRR